MARPLDQTVDRDSCTQLPPPQSGVSVVIRARNAAADLDELLLILREQELGTCGPLELVVVDNESTDSTAAVARRHGAKVVSLSSSRFSWGRAINMGVESATGSAIILLSADVRPAARDVLRLLVNRLTEPATAAVYGRQIPKPDAPIAEIARLQHSFPGADQTMAGGSGGGPPWRSNACAAFRRAVWDRCPFDEEVQAAEEVEWTLRLAAQGWCIVYCSSAVVFHSHRDPVWRGAVREWDLWVQYCRRRQLRHGPVSMLRWMLSKVRTHLRACRAVEGYSARKLAALCRLPLDVAAFGAVVGLMAASRSRSLRGRLWS
jgi:glycosyltransferase involved in cell wall biosynthesis